MSVAAPLAALGVLVGLPLALAYLHRRPKGTRVVSSVLLFRHLAGPSPTARRLGAALRHPISLTCVGLAMVCLVLALLDLRSRATERELVVFVVDTSTSMGARDPETGETRLVRARARVEEALASMPEGTQAALLTAGATAELRVEPTEHLARVREALAALAPTGSSAALPRALEVAHALAEEARAEVRLVSDGVGVELPAEGPAFTYVPVGQPGPNLGIERLAVRRADALGLAEVFLTLVADTAEPRAVEVELRVDERVVDVWPLELPGRGRVSRLHRLELPPGRRLHARLVHHGEDILPLDDEAQAAWDGGQRIRVLLVHEAPASFLEEALRLHPGVDLTVLPPGLQPSPGRWDLVLLASPETRTLPPTEHVVSLGLADASLGLPPSREVESPQIVRWDFDHPLFRFVDLSGLALPHARVYEAGPEAEALVESEHGPLAILLRHRDREHLAFGWDPAASDLGLRVAFVNLVANVVEWATPSPASDPSAATIRGESILDPVRVLPRSRPPDEPGRAPTTPPPWRWLVGLALALLAGETAIAWAVLHGRATWTQAIAGLVRTGARLRDAVALGRFFRRSGS